MIIVRFALLNVTLHILMQSAPWHTAIDVLFVQPPHEKLIHCLPVFNMNRKVSHPLLQLLPGEVAVVEGLDEVVVEVEVVEVVTPLHEAAILLASPPLKLVNLSDLEPHIL